MIAELQESPAAPSASDTGELIVVSPAARLTRARRAFAAADFQATVDELQAIPEHDRTTEVAGLLLRARKLRQIALAAEATDDEKAIRDAIATARELLLARRYAESVAHLEAIPKAARNDELSEVLHKALELHRGELEQQDELQTEWERVIRANSRLRLREFRPHVVEQLELDPTDEYARERLDLIDDFESHLKKREENVQAAKEAFQACEFSGTIRRLKDVHYDLWTDEIRDLHSHASVSRDQTQEVSRELYRLLVGTPSPDLSGSIVRLEALGRDPASLLREGLDTAESLQLLQSLVALAASQSNMAPFCNRVITRLRPEEYEALLEDATNGDGPSEGDPTPFLMRGLFSSLIARPLNEIRQHVRAMEPLRHVLKGNDAVQLQQWRDFLTSVDDFEWIRDQKWTWRDRLLENARTDQLEQTAKQLALTADCILSRDGDRMEQLIELLGASPPPRWSLLRRVFQKIQNYLKTKVWRDGTAAVISFRLAMGVVISVLGVVVAGLAGQMFRALVFDVGNVTACVVGGSLVGIWALFGTALNKLL